jgi:predicted nucleic acid-binding protein
MIVLDSSAVVELLVDSTKGSKVGSLFEAEQSHAPDLIAFEVLSAIRGNVRGSLLTPGAGLVAMREFKNIEARLQLWPLLEVMTERAIELRENVSAYDANYVALAEILECPLVTADARLGRAVADLIDVTVV